MNIKTTFCSVFLAICAASAHANFQFQQPREGTPVWHTPQSGWVMPGQTVAGQRVFTEQIPRVPQNQQWLPGGQQWGGNPNLFTGMPTISGITGISPPDWNITFGYTRRFAEFEFRTGVNSILQWDNMLINELSVGVEHNFNLRDVPLFIFGEYRRGTVHSAGLSMDFDLLPFNQDRPGEGIFTISIGDTAGTTNHIRLGFGARHMWNIGGWKLSPSIGYEIFRHDLRMLNHMYPNPAIFLPLLTDQGQYVFGNGSGEFIGVTPGAPLPGGDWFQVCLSPEDIRVAQTGPGGLPSVGPDGTLITVPYNPSWGNIPWGVGPGDCVIIGGDGPIKIPGVTHIYNTTWSGLFVGLEVEKQMTFQDRLRFYFQFGMPRYHAEGTWPHRTDWQQNPSFVDRGSNRAYSYTFEMEYIHQLSDRMQLSLRVDTNFFYVGQIGGDLHVAGFTIWHPQADGNYIREDIPPHTIHLSDALKYARWQSFGLRFGLSYSF